MREMMPPTDTVLIIYDGACPYCKAYVRLLRLQKAVGRIELLSARANDVRLRHYWQSGHDLNAGMLVVMNDQVYSGADAMQVLACCSTGSDLFNRVHRRIFSSKRWASWLYPLLRCGRRLTLFLLGIPLLRR
jgi:predicted DCC family thiol-disulfide oxidoreductase YuxK